MQYPDRSGIYQLALQPGERRITLAIPAGYNPEQATPLLIALHWGGPMRPFKGESILRKLVQPALAELGAILVAPDDETDGWDNPQGAAAILELVAQLQRQYNIGPNKTLLMGYSRGGRGAWYIAARHPQSFAAVLVMSANTPGDVTRFDWSILLYIIHSRADEEFPSADIEATINALQAKGAPVKLALVEGITHQETHRFVEPLRAALPWIYKIWVTANPHLTSPKRGEEP